MDNSDDKIFLWKTKKMLKELGNSRGNGTSMISLIIPPKEQVSKVMQMLLEEYGTASNIKSKVNKFSKLPVIGGNLRVWYPYPLDRSKPGDSLGSVPDFLGFWMDGCVTEVDSNTFVLKFSQDRVMKDIAENYRSAKIDYGYFNSDLSLWANLNGNLNE